MDIFSIGHSNHPIENFISLLQQHSIKVVADVRSHPYSRFLPHFNQNILKESLKKENIKYVFLGEELGARPSNQKCYVNGKALYEKIAATDLFKQGIERLIQGKQKYRIALMCAEKDPLTCHRAILVCQYLRHFDLNIYHILANGDLESHDELENRILLKQGFKELLEKNIKTQQLSLFPDHEKKLPTRQEALEIAYKRQGDIIAYVEQKNDHNEESDESIYDGIYS